MARRSPARQSKRPIESYDHRDKERLNNPPVGLVTPATDQDAGRKTYSYDPHLDPQLQWAGEGGAHILRRAHGLAARPRAHRPSHHHRGHAQAQRRRGRAGKPVRAARREPARPKTPSNSTGICTTGPTAWWAGDSLLVMNSLLEKEGMAGKVQMVYIDPPYGIRYGSNFHPPSRPIPSPRRAGTAATRT